MSRRTHSTPTRAVGYVRVSTTGQAEDGVSLDAQRQSLRAYCEATGLALVAIESDDGVSAKDLNRPGLQRALARLRARAADALLVAKLDRLTRSVRDLAALVDVYFASGSHALLSVSDAIDTRTAGGRMVLNMLGSVSQWEREAAGERTRDALAQVRREGVPLGGAALGWRRGSATDAKGRRVVEAAADELATVERIVALRCAGWSLRRIARALTEAGVSTKRGRTWHASTVRKVASRHAKS